MDKPSITSSRYLSFIAYESYIAAMSCVSTIVFLSPSPLSFMAFYSMLSGEKRSDVLVCFLFFHLFLRYLFRIDDDDSLKEKDHSSSPSLSNTNRPIPFYPETPSSTPPRRSKRSSSSPTFYQPPSSSESSYQPVSLTSDSDTCDINIRSDRFIAESKERFRNEIREDQLSFLKRKMAKNV